jgi:hypothetical protein
MNYLAKAHVGLNLKRGEKKHHKQTKKQRKA